MKNTIFRRVLTPLFFQKYFLRDIDPHYNITVLPTFKGGYRGTPPPGGVQFTFSNSYIGIFNTLSCRLKSYMSDHNIQVPHLQFRTADKV